VLWYLGRSQSPDLSGSLYFDTSDLDNLPIIGSYPFTFLCHLCIYTSYIRIKCCLVVYMVPRLRAIESSGTRCGDYYSVIQRPLP
jgi:hypothetical protein